MTLTPWGPSESFREQRGPGRSSDGAGKLGVRERLYGATIAVVAEKGAQRASVADIIEVAGVSRATFYKHFPDKQTCVLATVDVLARGTGALIAQTLATDGSWERRLQDALDWFVDMTVTYPAAAHLCLIDLWALGAAGTERNEQLIARLEAPVRAMFEESPEHAGMPPEIVRAIVGGVYKTVHGRVRSGRQDELRALTGDVCAWGASYLPPSATIRRPRCPSPPAPAGPQFAAHGKAGRLFAACVAEVAERGYAAMTIDDLARRAAMSLHTVYSLFAGGKEEILLATYDAGIAQADAVALPAYARHSDDWPRAVRAALEALLTYLAGDPAWARMSIVGTLGGGTRAMERSDRVIDSYAELLRPGLERVPGRGPIVLEATAGGVYTLVYEQVLTDPTRMLEILPLCTYVALAPFVGPDEALAVANDDGRGRSGAGAVEAPAPSA